MLFAEAADESSDAPLVLPQNWGNQNRTCVTTWVSENKLTHQVRVELEMHQHLPVVQAQNGQDEQDDAFNPENGNQQQDQNEEPQERRSARRRS